MSLSKDHFQKLLFTQHLTEILQLELSEISMLHHLLASIKPKTAIEIGTADGGSLSVIARYSNRVISIDTDPTCKIRLHDQFPNVEFVHGRSQEKLPSLIEEINAKGHDLEFVFIDGDHDTFAVRKDIESVIRYVPSTPLYVLMHDAFNPKCRAGIMQVDWSGSPYVHHVELDFIPGVLHQRNEIMNEMWGGFAIAVLLPSLRDHELVISQQYENLFNTVYDRHFHRLWINPIKSKVLRLTKRIFHSLQILPRVIITG